MPPKPRNPQKRPIKKVVPKKTRQKKPTGTSVPEKRKPVETPKPENYRPFLGSRIEYASKEAYLEAYKEFKQNYGYLSDVQIRLEWLIKHGVSGDKAFEIAENPLKFRESAGLD